MAKAEARAFSHRVTLDSTQRKITVVQCSACATKFAVETRVLLPLDAPRFHCSRCDNVFVLDRHELGLDREELPEIKPNPAYSSATYESEEDFDAPSWNAEPSSATVTTQTPRSLGVPKALEPSLHRGAPHESLPISDDSAQFTFDFSPAESAQLETPPSKDFESDAPFQISSSEFLAKHEQKEFEELEKDILGYSTLSRGMDSRAIESWSDSIVARELFDPAPASQDTAYTGTPRVSQLGRWRGLATVSAPLLLFLAILGGASLFAVSRPLSADAVATGWFSNLDAPAPAGLAIANATVKQVTLESGEVMNVISGRLINNSESDIRSVQVEGVLFDASGSVVARKKVDAGSSLGKTRIQSLTPEMIENLQTTPSSKRFSLKAGSSQEFTLAITEDPRTTSSMFSARIYSVRM